MAEFFSVISSIFFYTNSFSNPVLFLLTNVKAQNFLEKHCKTMGEIVINYSMFLMDIFHGYLIWIAWCVFTNIKMSGALDQLENAAEY